MVFVKFQYNGTQKLTHIISLLVFSINLGWLIMNLLTVLYQKVLHLA
jgi:hypothetical protein